MHTLHSVLLLLFNLPISLSTFLYLAYGPSFFLIMLVPFLSSLYSFFLCLLILLMLTGLIYFHSFSCLSFLPCEPFFLLLFSLLLFDRLFLLLVSSDILPHLCITFCFLRLTSFSFLTVSLLSLILSNFRFISSQFLLPFIV